MTRHSVTKLDGAVRGGLGIASSIVASAIFVFMLIPANVHAASFSEITETFTGFSCSGAWMAVAPSHYIRDCGNGWTAFAQDTQGGNQIGNQNEVTIDTTANGPSVASASDAIALLDTAPGGDAVQGRVWLLKTYPVQAGAAVQTIQADMRLKLSAYNNSQKYGIIVFDGIVTNPLGVIPLKQVVLQSGSALASDACNGVPAGNWCTWQTVNAGGQYIVPTQSYITVAFEVEDTNNSQISYGEVDNLKVSGVSTAVDSPLAATDISQLWNATYRSSGNNFTEAVDVVVDSSGNAYVTGSRYNGVTYVMLTRKYDVTGALQWSHGYNSGTGDQAVAIALGPSGYVYVVGRHFNSGGNNDYVVLRYDPSDGSVSASGAWSVPFIYDNAGQDDVPTGLAIDSSGIYVTGSTCGSASCDYATIKIDFSTGAQSSSWVPTTHEGKATGVKLDAAGNVFVTGTSHGASDDIVTIKYDSSGNQLWVKRYDSGWDERATAFVVDSAGNSYITGLTYEGGSPAILALKYDMNGSLQWQNVYRGSVYKTLPSALTIDADGNVYVSGKTGRVLDYDIVTVKFLGNDGTIAWAHTFGNAGFDDWGVDIAFDSSGKEIYVLGALTRSAGNTDFVTLKYDANGNAKSAITYDGSTLNDTPVALALGVDADGDAIPYVFGTSVDLDGVDEIALVRYEKVRPDLESTAISGPLSAVVGDAIIVDNTVLNVDDIPSKKHADSGAFDVKLYLTPASSGLPDLNPDHMTLLVTRSVTNLAPGESDSDSTSVTVPNVAQGNYYLVVQVDSGGAVTEQDETNNTLASGGTIAITSNKPDLTASNVSGPDSITRDSPFDVDVTVNNISTPAAGAFRVGIYLSTDTTIDGSDILIGTQTVGGLTGLGTYNATISATVSANSADPNYAATGSSYYLGVIVDDLNAVDEGQEGNNTAIRQGAGNNTMLTTYKDFLVDDLSTTGAAEIGSGANAHIELGHASVAWTLTGTWNVPSVGSGDYSSPSLGDLNGDGTLDLLIGTYSNATLGYENIGSVSAPQWQANTAWDVAAPTVASEYCSGLTSAPGLRAHPSVADMNGDGIPDLLLIGYHNGICAFRNAGNTIPPTWTRETAWDVPSGAPPTLPDLSLAYNAPTLGDLDNDGLPDLLVGKGSNPTLLAYKNTGDKTHPQWTYTPAWNIVRSASSTYTFPSLVNLLGDFHLTTMYGWNNNGQVRTVENYGAGSLYNPIWHETDAYNITSGVNYPAPTFGDLDNDGRVDAMVGQQGGSVRAFQNTGAFYTNGTYTSKVVDSGSHDTFTTLSYASVEPSGTSLSVDIRAGDVADTNDSSWTSWLTGISVNGDISALGTHRYIQYRANLANSGSYEPPSDITVGTQKLYGLGASASDQSRGSYIMALPGGGFRLYYDYNNGTYWQLAYRDTTDTNVPNSTNLGPQVLMGVGSSANDKDYSPFIAALPGGGYRLYYTITNSSYRLIAYQDTTDGNLPNENNLNGTPTTLLGTGPSDRAAYGSLLQLSSGVYRLYYGYYNGSYWSTRYVETTDTNPPSSANIGAPVDVIGTSSSDNTIGGTVVLLPTGNYRMYYSSNTGSGWQSAYRDTTDSNPPNGSNLGGQVLLGLGVSAGDQIVSIQLFQLPSGQYRLNYGYNNGSYYQLAYSDGVPVNSTVSPALYSIQAFYDPLPTSSAVSVVVGDGSGGGELSATELLVLGLFLLYVHGMGRRRDGMPLKQT